MVLPKRNKISDNSEFEKIYRKGRKMQGEFLTLIFLKNRNGISRFGVVVSGKVSKKATERNRIKRKITEIIRKDFADFKGGFDFLILAKPESLSKKSDNLKKDLMSILRKIRVPKLT